jgi:hypothetical protein
VVTFAPGSRVKGAPGPLAERRSLGIVGIVLATGAIGLVSAQAREIVHFNGASSGIIVVKAKGRRLYYVLDEGLGRLIAGAAAKAR